MKIGIETQRLVLLLVVTAPWLLPPIGGPSPSLVSWLFSLACTAILIVLLFSKQWQGKASSVVPVAWLTAALISSAMGLCQYFGVSWQLVPWMTPPTAPGEAFANLRQRNHFSTLTNIGLAALLYVATSGVREASRLMVRIGLLAAAVLLATGNAASSSRTGLVQLLLLLGAGWFWSGRRHAEARMVLAAALGAYAVSTLALPALLGFSASEHGLWGRMSPGNAGCGSRVTLWSNVLDLISLRPWLGWGWGELDYAHFMTLYAGPRFCEILDNAHNLPLHLAVELGIPAALLICGGALWLVLRAQPWREKDPGRQLAWSVLAVILLHSMLEYPLWFGPFQLALGLCIWLLWPSRKKCPNMPVVPQEPPWWPRVLAVSLLVGAAYAAWDYHRVSQIFYPPDFRAPAYRDNTLE
ncbi:MAG: Wzy polymerase domain-containing protein, partial [Hylemonella sp.]